MIKATTQPVAPDPREAFTAQDEPPQKASPSTDLLPPDEAGRLSPGEQAGINNVRAGTQAATFRTFGQGVKTGKQLAGEEAYARDPNTPPIYAGKYADYLDRLAFDLVEDTKRPAPAEVLRRGIAAAANSVKGFETIAPDMLGPYLQAAGMPDDRKRIVAEMMSRFQQDRINQKVADVQRTEQRSLEHVTEFLNSFTQIGAMPGISPQTKSALVEKLFTSPEFTAMTERHEPAVVRALGNFQSSVEMIASAMTDQKSTQAVAKQLENVGQKALDKFRLAGTARAQVAANVASLTSFGQNGTDSLYGRIGTTALAFSERRKRLFDMFLSPQTRKVMDTLASAKTVKEKQAAAQQLVAQGQISPTYVASQMQEMIGVLALFQNPETPDPPFSDDELAALSVELAAASNLSGGLDELMNAGTGLALVANAAGAGPEGMHEIAQRISGRHADDFPGLRLWGQAALDSLKSTWSSAAGQGGHTFFDALNFVKDSGAFLTDVWSRLKMPGYRQIWRGEETTDGR